MYNITLIGTIHSENGQCNSGELYKIIESINPQVIFDELPIDFIDMYYDLNRYSPEVPLELICIRKYLQQYNIKVFPVDIDVRQKLSEYQNEILSMFSTFFKNEDYKKLDDEKEASITQEGFHYLNSDEFLAFLEKKEIIEKNIIDSEIHKDRLFNIYKLFQLEQYDNRENVMLQNIYNYSKENQYNQAVFLIGAEHKKSIMQKISEHDKLNKMKMNWTMYSNK